jgi:hypothetical protein
MKSRVFWDTMPCSHIVDSDLTTLQYIPEDSGLNTRRRENLKSHTTYAMVVNVRFQSLGRNWSCFRDALLRVLSSPDNESSKHFWNVSQFVTGVQGAVFQKTSPLQVLQIDSFLGLDSRHRLYGHFLPIRTTYRRCGVGLLYLRTSKNRWQHALRLP